MIFEKEPSCLDAAYEREAVKSGLVKQPVFPENRMYYNSSPKSDPIVDSVRFKYKRRSEAGIAKYGTTLDRTDIDLVGWLTHLQEELMDATLYLERAIREEIDRGIDAKRNSRKA